MNWCYQQVRAVMQPAQPQFSVNHKTFFELIVFPWYLSLTIELRLLFIYNHVIPNQSSLAFLGISQYFLDAVLQTVCKNSYERINAHLQMTVQTIFQAKHIYVYGIPRMWWAGGKQEK